MHPKQVIVVRTDLRNTQGHKVRTGKLIAQAGPMSEIAPLIPVYRRGKNRLIDITERDFDDKHGHFAKLRVARYYDKNDTECEIVLQVMWITPSPLVRDK